jgi:hypothetical protein
LSIDERDELEDEVEGEFEGLPFILNPDIISAYGETYNVDLDKDDAVVVTSAEAVQAVKCSLFRPR